MRMNNLELYFPEDKPFGERIQYLRDDKGRDYYETRKQFTKKYVILFDSFGVVRCATETKNLVFTQPLGMSIVDINVLPKDFDLFGKDTWVFDGKKLERVDVDPSVSTAIRKERALKKINKLIVPLQDAVDLEEATEEEIEKYKSLRKLRIQLTRISDDTPVTEVDWSEFNL